MRGIFGRKPLADKKAADTATPALSHESYDEKHSINEKKEKTKANQGQEQDKQNVVLQPVPFTKLFRSAFLSLYSLYL
jgi:hypothetical protein